MPGARLRSIFRYLPKEIFRLNNGPDIRLRAAALRSSRAFDILTVAGKVQPKALEPETYEGPNGASMRPNTPVMQKLVRRFRGRSVVVYRIPQGTRLPDDLILALEHGSHYSLQAAREMSVEELNQKITAFLNQYATLMTREQWLQVYPEATDVEEAETPATATLVAGAASPDWVWDEARKTYRRWENGQWVYNLGGSSSQSGQTATQPRQQGQSQAGGAGATRDWVWDKMARRYRSWNGKEWIWQ